MTLYVGWRSAGVLVRFRSPSVYFKKPHENDFFHLSREKIEDVPNSTWFGTELRFLSSISVIDSGSMLGTGSALEHSQESSSELTLSEVKNS